MKKRLMSILLITSMIGVMLTGCGGKSGSGDSEQKEEEGTAKETITFMAPDWAIPTDDQLAAFTEETGIEVEISEVGWDDIREKLATASSAGQCTADVVEVDWSWVGEFYAADWLEPLEVSDAKATQTMALPEAIGVTKTSEHKEAAKKFVEWYTSADMQKQLNETNSAIPTRNSVLEELINDGTIQNAGAMLEQAQLIASPFPNGVPSYYAEMSSAMYNAINKMALGELTAEEAFNEMETALEKLINE